MYLVTRGDFRSRDKDGGHTIAQNPCWAQANFTAVSSTEQSKFYIAGIGEFRPFLLPWPWPDDFRIRTWQPYPWRCTCAPKLNSYYIQPDATGTSPRSFVGGKKTTDSSRGLLVTLHGRHADTWSITTRQTTRFREQTVTRTIYGCTYDVCLEARGEIIRTVLCCIVYWSCAQS